MSKLEYAKAQLNELPESVVNKVIEFIAFQRFSLGHLDSDTDYLMSIPGMAESIHAGGAELIEDCIPVEEIWPDV